MQEAGIKPYYVPADNFHIIPPKLYKKASGDDGTAATFITKQGIIFDAEHFRDNPVNFGAVALHELLHLKAHLSMEVQEEGGTPYREGVTIYGHHRESHRHLAGLHEAIVAETEKRLLVKLLELPELSEEKRWLMSDEAKEMKKRLAEEKGIPEDDIIWVSKKGSYDWKTVSYLGQRDVLNYVCAEIQKKFPDEYQSADDVYKIFLNAHFTGRLLPLARIVEKTFGEGSFRLLGNMDTDRQSGVLHLESLKKARARQTRDKTVS